MFFAHDHPDFVTQGLRNDYGIHLGKNADTLLLSADISVPRGLYMATWRFSEVQDGSCDVTIRTMNDQSLVISNNLKPSDSGHVRIALPLEVATSLKFELRSGHEFQAIFKDLTVERLSPDPKDHAAIPEYSNSGIMEIGKSRVIEIPYIHHIAYEHRPMQAEESAYMYENMRISKELYSDSKQLIWDQVSLRDMIASQFSADVVLTFDRLRTAANRSELGRYCLLYSMGGLYIDPWVRMVNPIDIPLGKDIACFRSASVEQGASWSVDTAVLYASAGQAELEQLIEQIVESTSAGTFGTMPSSVTGGERLGRMLAVTYDAKRYFGGEIIPVTRGLAATSDGFLSQDGRLVAIRKGLSGPFEDERAEIRQAWQEGRIYAS